ncbi:NnrS family protein [Aestuariirhabdus litorea]|uniref:NnrS family protein n=1 Tax=Aestuariirhabdus litorea TaxID=2528527 RepID=A0A3P3VLU4_9GAMM|nr:NnrS family protein [Aestuariirhabdus litorea]RRJ83394.1 NnrS family protein [Aestuariirhabdus litorea]RWW93555.1 NnrS family protein [Endozoicomonadaceae bacterium GTF-13]
MTLHNIQSPQPASGFALFELGFRPFFLLAGWLGVVLVAIWGAVYANLLSLNTYYGLIGWHSHEMLFGYTPAVIGGFLLTAVRNWTGVSTIRGPLLAGLALVWLAARILPLVPAAPHWLIAAVDLAFLPCLIIALVPPLMQGKAKNWMFVVILAVMASANALVHAERLGISGLPNGAYLMSHLIMLIIVIMGGRVIPFFTEAGVRPVQIQLQRREWVDRLSIALVIALAIAQTLAPYSPLTPLLAGLAALAHGVRLIGWYHPLIWQYPLLWILHLSYLWLVLGLALIPLASLGLVSPFVALHAFTTGAIGGITLGMMARVALGHSGRPLVTSRWITLAFVAIQLCALVRVFGPLVWPGSPPLISLSALLWVIAFGLFSLIYTPILIRPRIDGRPG